MSYKFATWLSEKLKEYGWSARELGRRAGISNTSINNVLAEKTSPTFAFCLAIAAPLKVPAVEVFRVAGLVKHPSEKDMTYQELVEILEKLTEEERLEVVKYAKYLMRGG